MLTALCRATNLHFTCKDRIGGRQHCSEQKRPCQGHASGLPSHQCECQDRERHGDHEQPERWLPQISTDKPVNSQTSPEQTEDDANLGCLLPNLRRLHGIDGVRHARHPCERGKSAKDEKSRSGRFAARNKTWRPVGDDDRQASRGEQHVIGIEAEHDTLTCSGRVEHLPRSTVMGFPEGQSKRGGKILR